MKIALTGVKVTFEAKRKKRNLGLWGGTPLVLKTL
jgi:hypothetical protein